MQIFRKTVESANAVGLSLPDCPFPSTDVKAVARLLDLCPVARPTPLLEAEDLAKKLGVAEIWVKDERSRMGLGSFKALGAAYVIAVDAADSGADLTDSPLSGVTYVTASAGNHGMSVAAGARVFGAGAVIYIAESVPESFARRLREKGAEVVRAGQIYEESMAAAAKAAADNGWRLLSDSSWAGYFDVPHRLMEGYLILMQEVFAQVESSPTHIFLQAGVGGLAGAAAALARDLWGDAVTIVVVEPDAAPAIYGSVRAGHAVAVNGPVSCMGRLDCKEPSLIALKGLARDANLFITISEEEAESAMQTLSDSGLATTPSGGAGLAALIAAGSDREALGLAPDSRVLVILSEGPEE